MTTFSAPWGNYLLKDLVEALPPEAISWWPQTLGWQLVYLIVFITLIRKTIEKIKIYKRNAYRREALLWLDGLPTYDQAKPQEIYRKLPTLIRKTAIAAFSREQVAQLSGNDWETWLDEQCPASCFSKNCPNLLHQLAYAPRITIGSEKMLVLIQQIKQWIELHRSQYD